MGACGSKSAQEAEQPVRPVKGPGKIQIPENMDEMLLEHRARAVKALVLQIQEQHIRFAVKKAEISPSGLKVLRTVAQAMEKMPELALRVEGHANFRGDTGTRCMNAKDHGPVGAGNFCSWCGWCGRASRTVELSAARAEECKKALRAEGVKNEITCVGLGWQQDQHMDYVKLIVSPAKGEISPKKLPAAAALSVTELDDVVLGVPPMLSPVKPAVSPLAADKLKTVGACDEPKELSLITAIPVSRSQKRHDQMPSEEAGELGKTKKVQVCDEPAIIESQIPYPAEPKDPHSAMPPPPPSSHAPPTTTTTSTTSVQLSTPRGRCVEPQSRAETQNVGQAMRDRDVNTRTDPYSGFSSSREAQAMDDVFAQLIQHAEVQSMPAQDFLTTSTRDACPRGLCCAQDCAARRCA